MKTGAGALTELIAILTSAAVAVAVASITRSGQTATVTTSAAHGFSTGDYVTHAGASQAEYNVQAPVTVTGATTYTFAVSGSPASPATGTITSTYTSDSQGGAGSGWNTLATVFAKVRALSASEQLALGGVSAIGSYMVSIYYRADVTPKMRLSWTPWGFTTAKVLEIHGVQPDPDDPRRLLQLSVGEVVG